MRLRKVLAILLTAALMFLQLNLWVYACEETPPPKPSGLTDIGPDDWAYNAVKEMVDKKIISGYPDCTFRPDSLMSRAEFATIMVLALGLPAKNPETPSFRDIDRNRWEYRYVEAAKYYLTGFKTPRGDYFKPAAPAVREDMAVALVKALGYGDEEISETILDSFADRADISPKLTKYVASAVYHKIMLGYPLENSEYKVFKPQNPLTREEAASLFYKVINQEKITYDEKNPGPVITPAPELPPEVVPYTAPEVTGAVYGNKIVLRWDPISDKGLQGYKVVISKNNPKPKYPDDGYLYWITDKTRAYAVIDNCEPYKNGDFGEYLTPGEQYYFSITAVYSDKKVPGNVITIEFPG